MAKIISHNIISPLGYSSIENYNAILEGKSAITTYPGLHDGLRPYSASLFSTKDKADLSINGYSIYESLVIKSIQKSLTNIKIDISSNEVCLILSTTKGNIEHLDKTDNIPVSVSDAAQRIADYLGIKTTPLTVCNACISGVTAMLLAQRLIDQKAYKYIIVCGCDIQSEFIISGFQSLNAVSPNPCRPFDIERMGLSLGEAAASVILTQSDGYCNDEWTIVNGFIRNDAYHNTTPSPNGDGCCLALKKLTESGCDDIAFINAHGTATMFNDQMESKAIEQAGLSHIPVNALKGYFGHTMGAAGIIETIISMIAIDSGMIIGTQGFSFRGVSGKINIVSQQGDTDKKSFIKIISGFGGCNGALLMTKRPVERGNNRKRISLNPIHSVKITPKQCIVDGVKVETNSEGKALLKELYSKYIGNYPKFHKMDLLCQLGFVTIEILQQIDDCNIDENSSVILFNSSSSIATDKEYMQTISDAENYFPSPALFVYTLPNIVLSEIAIKNQIKGETAFYILPQKNLSLIDKIVESTLIDDTIKTLVTGWIDCYDDANFVAEISVIKN